MKRVFHCLLASVLVTVEKLAFGPVFVPSPFILLLSRFFFSLLLFHCDGYVWMYFFFLGVTELPECEVSCLESILNNFQTLYVQMLLLKFLIDFCWTLLLSLMSLILFFIYFISLSLWIAFWVTSSGLSSSSPFLIWDVSVLLFTHLLRVSP